MSTRQIGFAFEPTTADEAVGVTIHRAIGGERLALLDPFLLLDHVSVDPTQTGGEIGFPRHPHRGIETLSYVLQGQVAHKDSLGNAGRVGSGGSQWMTAGNGIYHEEMLAPDAEGGEFLQLWFSLPAAKKRIPAAYVGAEPGAVPVVTLDGASVRVVAGLFGGKTGPFVGIAVNPTVLDVKLSAGRSIELPAPKGEATFVYVVSGAIEGSSLSAPYLAVFADGDGVVIKATEDARFLFVSARSLNEPVLQYRSLVMNSVDDIKETYEMMEAGTFGKA